METATETQPEVQETTINATESQKESEFLQKLVGEWTVENAMEGGQSPGPWTETIRSFGGNWILIEGRIEAPGDPRSISILGYDPQRKRVVGSLVWSTVNYMWVFEGTLDPTGRVLTLATEGPNFAPGREGQICMCRDEIELKSDDFRVITSRAQKRSGEWKDVSIAHARRKS